MKALVKRKYLILFSLNIINFSDHIRLIGDWTGEEIQRKDFTENIRLDSDGGLKLTLMEDSIMKQQERKGIPLPRDTKVAQSKPFTKPYKNLNIKPKKGKKNQQEVVLDRTFELDETLPVLEYG